MNSHFQSSDTTWTLSGFSFDDNGFAGSRSCDPIQATLPRSMIVSSGMDQVMSSILPDSTKLGWKRARLLDDRYHHPNMSAARIVGTTIGSMMMSEPIRIDDVPSATTPRGWRTISCSQPLRAKTEMRPTQRRARVAGDRPLTRGLSRRSRERKSGSSSIGSSGERSYSERQSQVRRNSNAP